ncbi:MAG: class I SAM-dependent methyltransferase [Hyphomicrobiales bacterium]|nr:MAG: class I SAM-dependent methyltransferase [Hyphomicrobiales bacterium]
MSRWRQDPDGAAAEIVRRSLPALGLEGRVLLGGAGTQTCEVLRSAGISVTQWSRRIGDTASPTTWPSGGPFDVALLRLAKARDESEMNLHAVSSVLADSGRIVLFGGNDEGIRSGISDLEALCGASEMIGARAHGRIVSAPRADPARIKATLAEWRRVHRLSLPSGARDWVTYPGLFAGGSLDEGTALLLTALPNLKATAHVLDYGCGSGPISAAMQAKYPELRIDMLDADVVALTAATENVPGGKPIAGASLAETGIQRYDAILSNPPLHAGVAEDHAALERLIAQAPKHLKPGGLLLMVVQRRVALEEALGALFSEVQVVAENGRYRVWRASAGRSVRDAGPPPRVR